MPRRKVNRVYVGVEFRAIPSKGGSPSFDERLVEKLEELKRTQGEDFIADKIKNLIRIAFASGWPDNEPLHVHATQSNRESVVTIVDAEKNDALDDSQVNTIPAFLIPSF